MVESVVILPAAGFVQEHDFSTVSLQQSSREKEQLFLSMAQHVLFKGSVKTAPGVDGGPEIDCLESIDYGIFGIRV